MQDRPGGIVAEGHVPELDGRLDAGQDLGVRLVGDGHRHVEHLEDAVRRSHRPLHDRVLH